MMRRAAKLLEAGTWNAAHNAGDVLLTFHDRYRRRILLRDAKGGEFLLDLAKPAILRDGDGLELDTGEIIAVHAADEAVADVSAATPADIARIAWHIGNRHTPVEVLHNGSLRIRDDAVLVKMIEGVGGSVTRRQAPFSPEPGAYAPQASAAHRHDHSHHDHGHDHDHPHPHPHSHSHD